MKFLIAVLGLLFVGTLNSSGAIADPAVVYEKKKCTEWNQPETRFGFYGYRHCELHDLGIVAQLQNTNNSPCCDGKSSGECRVTALDMTMTKVYIDGEWYPIPPGIAVRTNIKLPREFEAVACAGKRDYTQSEVPGIYCIAAREPST